MKRKKGFTLIELLVVICVLALLVLFAVPTIFKLLNQSRKDSFRLEAENIITIAENIYATEILNKEEPSICYTLEDLKTYSDKNFNGYSGSIKVNLDGSSQIWLSNQSYITSLTQNYKTKVVVFDNSGSSASSTCGE